MTLDGFHLGNPRHTCDFKSPFPATDSVQSPTDSRGLYTTDPRSSVSHNPASWLIPNEMSPGIYPRATAQPLYTPHSSVSSLLSPPHTNALVKRDPGLDEDEDNAWKVLPSAAIGSGYTGHSLPQHMTNYDDSEAYTVGLKSEDFFEEGLFEEDLTSHDRQVFRTHTSGIIFGKTTWKKPGSYLRYSADGMQGEIAFDFKGNVTKGFFFLEGEPYTYRRNYFETTGSLTLTAPWGYTHTDYIEVNGPAWTPVPVDGFAVGISALSEEEETSVQLFQFTPKRDKGKKSTPENIGLVLQEPIPVDCDADGLGQQDFSQRSGGFNFERLQFSKATRNNGKRIGVQKYFQVRVSLYIRRQDQTYTEIAYRDSPQVIVRGRSPGHYLAGPNQKRKASSEPSSCLYLKSEFPRSEFDEEMLEEIPEDVPVTQQRNGFFGGSSIIILPPLDFPRGNGLPDHVPDTLQSNGYFASSSTSLGSSSFGLGSSNFSLPRPNISYGNRLPEPWETPTASYQSFAPYSNVRQCREGDLSSRL